MTLWQSLVLLAVLCLAAASEASAQDIEISIETIESGQFISGQVQGLEAAEVPRHRVVVYVHTDMWYIHPYAGQGEGLSWASINRDGSWKIETVKRRFPADLVAALVVPRNYMASATVESLRQIKSIASYTEKGKDRL